MTYKGPTRNEVIVALEAAGYAAAKAGAALGYYIAAHPSTCVTCNLGAQVANLATAAQAFIATSHDILLDDNDDDDDDNSDDDDNDNDETEE